MRSTSAAGGCWGGGRWRHSTDYVDEDRARKARRGMWRGTFVKPWEWRVRSTAPAGIHVVGSGRDAKAGDGSASFQLIGLGEASGLRYPVGQMAKTTSRPGEVSELPGRSR